MPTTLLSPLIQKQSSYLWTVVFLLFGVSIALWMPFYVFGQISDCPILQPYQPYDETSWGKCCWVYHDLETTAEQLTHQELNALEQATEMNTDCWELQWSKQVDRACMIADIQPCTPTHLSLSWEQQYPVTSMATSVASSFDETLANVFVEHTVRELRNTVTLPDNHKTTTFLQSMAMLRYMLGKAGGYRGQLLADATVEILGIHHKEYQAQERAITDSQTSLQAWYDGLPRTRYYGFYGNLGRIFLTKCASQMWVLHQKYSEQCVSFVSMTLLLLVSHKFPRLIEVATKVYAFQHATHAFS